MDDSLISILIHTIFVPVCCVIIAFIIFSTWFFGIILVDIVDTADNVDSNPEKTCTVLAYYVEVDIDCKQDGSTYDCDCGNCLRYLPLLNVSFPGEGGSTRDAMAYKEKNRKRSLLDARRDNVTNPIDPAEDDRVLNFFLNHPLGSEVDCYKDAGDNYSEDPVDTDPSDEDDYDPNAVDYHYVALKRSDEISLATWIQLGVCVVVTVVLLLIAFASFIVGLAALVLWAVDTGIGVGQYTPLVLV